MMSNIVKVVPYEASRATDWERYVRTNPRSVVAHSLAWKAVVEKAYGHLSFYLMAYRENHVVGVLPLFLIRSPFFGKFLVTAPFLTFGGLLCDDETAEFVLSRKLKELVRDLGCDYAEIRNQLPVSVFENTKSIYCSPMLDLSVGEDALLKGLDRGARFSLNRGQRENLEVVEGPENLGEFIALHRQMMHRLGTPDHRKLFFENIQTESLGTHLLMIRHKKRFVAGMLMTTHNDKVELPWAACRKDYFKFQTNTFMYWQGICWACRQGFRTFDFGRSQRDSGTFRYKMQFGCQPAPIYYQYELKPGTAMPEVDPHNPRFKWVIAAWKKFPSALVNTIGPWVIRDIP